MNNINNFVEYLDSSFGTLEVCADEKGITTISFVKDDFQTTKRSELTKQAIAQLGEYFAGKRTQFDLSLIQKESLPQ